MVLPCMGSQDHTTMRPSRFTARMSSGRCFSTLSAPKRADQRQAARLVFGIQDVDEPDQFIRLQRRAAFQANRVFDAAAEFDMGMIGLAGAVADPQHVARGCIPVAGG